MTAEAKYLNYETINLDEEEMITNHRHSKLISFFDRVTSLMAERNAVDIINLDFIKAFGTAPHDIANMFPVYLWQCGGYIC